MITINTVKLAVDPVIENNVIEVNFKHLAPRRSTNLYKTDGCPKASAADPIRSQADIRAMQEYFLSHGKLRDYTLFTVGICFGLRAGDLLSLKIHHILNPDGTFKSHCALIEEKRRKFNNPAITPQIQIMLTHYLETLDTISYDDPLWRSRNRNQDGTYRAITITQLNRILKEASVACNISGHISSHSLRKTFAYQLLKANPNDTNVQMALQQMLNHNDFKTTLRYCGITQDIMDEYRSDLEAALFG